MQPKFAHRDEYAWEKGDMAYDLGDTVEVGVIKAEQAGIRPGCNGYAAFLTAFSRRVRSKEVSPRKAALSQSVEPESSSAMVFTPDFMRAAS